MLNASNSSRLRDDLHRQSDQAFFQPCGQADVDLSFRVTLRMTAVGGSEPSL